MTGVPCWVILPGLESCDSHRFCGTAKHLCSAGAPPLHRRFVLAWSEVSFEDDVVARFEARAGEIEHHGETGVAELARLRGVHSAQEIEQRFLDRVLAEQRNGVTGGQRPGESGFTGAGEACDEDEVTLPHAGECATLEHPATLAQKSLPPPVYIIAQVQEGTPV